jgi:hypothetical protein
MGKMRAGINLRRRRGTFYSSGMEQFVSIFWFLHNIQGSGNVSKRGGARRGGKRSSREFEK